MKGSGSYNSLECHTFLLKIRVSVNKSGWHRVSRSRAKTPCSVLNAYYFNLMESHQIALLDNDTLL